MEYIGGVEQLLQQNGPAIGSRGEVVLIFEENPVRVGVKFAEAFPGGIDLGGACEPGHGWFIDVANLRFDSQADNDEISSL